MAAINRKPDSIKSAILNVPFLDFMGLLKCKSEYLAESDYDEFGDPNILADFEHLYSICPYSNIQ